MRTLIYKRTHPGDPGVEGCFGVHDCMGRVRAWKFEAVIGVGGLGAEPESHGLDGKINWIGIGPRKKAAAGKRGPTVTFDHYVFYGAKGPSFIKRAPRLANRIYARNVRAMMDDLDAAERKEVDKLLASALHAPPSPGRRTGRASQTEKCAPRAKVQKTLGDSCVTRAKRGTLSANGGNCP